MLRKPKTSVKILINTSLVGAILGVFAQFLRQMPGALLYLGASTTPWVMVGLLLAVLASRGAHTQRKAFLVATGNVAVYLIAWLVSYHLLFVIRESVSLAAGWRQAVPWLVIAIPASLLLGLIAAMSHKRGVIGDICLAVPIALSIPEILMYMKEGRLIGTAVMTPIVVLSSLLIYMAIKERRVSIFVVLSALVSLGALGIVLFPVVSWFFRL